MYLRSETNKTKGPFKIVCFCKACNSQDIQITRICRNCGSTDIAVPTGNILDDIPEQSRKYDYIEEEKHYFSCDICGKEFATLDRTNPSDYITYSETENKFVSYIIPEEKDCNQYVIDKDICCNCKDLLTTNLNKQLLSVRSKSNVSDTLESMTDEDYKVTIKLAQRVQQDLKKYDGIDRSISQIINVMKEEVESGR